MSGPFATVGSALDSMVFWLFGAAQGATRRVLASDDLKRIGASGVAFALAGAAPALAKAAAAQSSSELMAALTHGFVAGAAGSASAALHRYCHGDDPSAPPLPPAESGAVPLADSPLGEKRA